MMLFNYLDYIPELPAELVHDVINHETINRSWFYDERYKFYRVSESLKEWVYANIKDVTKVGIQEITGNLLPHIDRGRTKAINYLITTGGGSLCHYSYNGVYEQDRFVSLDLVTEISRINIEPFKWHMINTQVLHGVDNITSPRLALTVNVE